MIVRTWRGATEVGDADSYLDYLRRTGFAEYASADGNVAVLGLRRRERGRAEFLLISLWESPEAVARFAGRPSDRAVFYPEDDHYLVDRDEHVDHYDIVFVQGKLPPPDIEGEGEGESSDGRTRRDRGAGWNIAGFR